MIDDQFRELRTLIQNLAVEIERIKLQLKKQDEMSATRHSAVMERLDDYEVVLDAASDLASGDILKKLFPDQN